MSRNVKITLNLHWLLVALAVMVILKLTDVIAISWLWVFLWPILGWLALGVLFFGVVFLILALWG